MRSRDELIAKYPGGIQIRGDLHAVIGADSAAFHGKKPFELSSLLPVDIALLRRLQSGISADVLQKLSLARAWKLIALLDDRGALKYFSESDNDTSVLNRQVEWLSYFHHAPGALQKDIERRKVMVVGCGGTGAIIATHLARVGINQFVLIDPADVDAPDLNRQLSYYPADVGTRKVDALAADLRRLRLAVIAQTFAFAVEGAERLAEWVADSQPDLIINCADKPVGLIQSWVAEASRAQNVPVLFGGVGLGDASVGPLLIDDASKEAYAAAMTRAHFSFNAGEQPLKASLCFTNSWASVMIAFEAFKYLTGIGELKTLNRSLVVDFFEHTTNIETQWPANEVVLCS